MDFTGITHGPLLSRFGNRHNQIVINISKTKIYDEQDNPDKITALMTKTQDEKG